MTFTKGQKVESKFDSDDEEYYDGIVEAVNADGTYYIIFDDGDIKDNVKQNCVRPSSNAGENIQESSDKEQVNETANASDEYHESDLQLSAELVLSRVEEFLLPSVNERYWAIRGDEFGLPSTPKVRLDDVLHELAIADHIKLMQSLYREAEDDQLLELDIRINKEKITSKVLMERITEGRARVLALCKLCYGQDTLEELRAQIDLASSYSSQGMWPQVLEHMTAASHKLLVVYNKRRTQAFEQANKKARSAASRVSCIFRVLRKHVAVNGGEIKHVFLKELMVGFDSISDARPYGSVSEFSSSQPMSQPAQLITLLHDFLERHQANRTNSGSGPSWGDAVDFLRKDCGVMTGWLSEIDNVLLPQNKALLRLAFQAVDIQKKGVVSMPLLQNSIARFPALAKSLAGSDFIQKLGRITTKIVLALAIGPSGAIEAVGDLDGPSVEYDLPLAWEEVLALHVEECDTDSLDVLRIQILTLMGVCQVFSNQVTMAEETMRDALKHLERLGLEMEVPACELYNSIAQMMITKNRQYHAAQKAHIKVEAEKYLDSGDGQREIESEGRSIRKVNKERGMPITKEEAEQKARASLRRELVKSLIPQEEDPTLLSLQAAHRYLIKSHEILERVHGQAHPCVASACLAIASVQNVSEDFVEAKEWLVKALRIMEPLNPRPGRAIAFIQLQLANVLGKLQVYPASMQVMHSAMAFHLELAELAVERHASSSKRGLLQNPVVEGQSGYEDVRTALSLMERLMLMASEQGTATVALEYSERIADLAERAFGWDSQEAALTHEEAGRRCLALKDWDAACLHLKSSLEAHEMCFGDSDPRTTCIADLYLHYSRAH